MPTTISRSVVDLWNRALSRIGVTKKLSSIDDRSAEAECCRIHYGDCLIAVLETMHWSFTTKQAQLSEAIQTWVTTTTYAAADQVRYEGLVYTAVQSTTGNNPADDDGTYWAYAYALAVGWDYAYALPGDFVSFIAFLTSTGTPMDTVSFDIVSNGVGDGSVLVTDLDTDDFGVIEYTAIPGVVESTTGELQENPGVYPRQFVDAIVWALAVELALGIKKDERMADRMLKRFNASVQAARDSSRNFIVDRAEPETPSVAIRSF